MERTNNTITIHKCIFEEQNKKVIESIRLITEKDSLSINDTQAIRLLLDVCDVLSNPAARNDDLHQEVDNNEYYRPVNQIQ